MKKILCGIVLGVMACVALADSFNWGLSADDGLGIEFSYAQVVLGPNGGTAIKVGDTLISAGSQTTGTMSLDGISADMLAENSGNYFYVEYLNSNMETVAVSQLLAASAAQSHIASGSALPEGGVWLATQSAVPEPSSGLLMLLGLAGLALRRKRV